MKHVQLLWYVCGDYGTNSKVLANVERLEAGLLGSITVQLIGPPIPPPAQGDDRIERSVATIDTKPLPGVSHF